MIYCSIRNWRWRKKSGIENSVEENFKNSKSNFTKQGKARIEAHRQDSLENFHLVSWKQKDLMSLGIDTFVESSSAEFYFNACTEFEF